ncbi:hypothetical protein OA005_00565 [Paracoccaceae bacterium]|nr:hypothetical protein [Paracoccaceae bacterium]
MIYKKKPTISVVSTAYRPQNWMNVYRSLNKNEIVDADFIFVGPNTPQFNLPQNFKFIRSKVKPAQCLEIAYRHSSSDYTLNIADDVVFKEDCPLDKLYNKYQSYKTDKIIVSPVYQMDDKLIELEKLVLNQEDPSSPAMPVGSFMSRKLYNELGGIDKNFMAVMYDLDIALRVYSIGGRVVFSEEVTAYEDRVVASAGGSLCVDYASIDKNYLHSIWEKRADGTYKRKKKVESFSNKDITLYSQGPRGRWRGKNALLYEMVIDSPRFFSKLKRGFLKPNMYLNYAFRILRFIQSKRKNHL